MEQKKLKLIKIIRSKKILNKLKKNSKTVKKTELILLNKMGKKIKQHKVYNNIII